MRVWYIYALFVLPIASTYPATPQLIFSTLATRTSEIAKNGSQTNVPTITHAPSDVELKRRGIEFYSDTCGYFSDDLRALTCGTNSGCFTWEEASAQGCCDIGTAASDCTIKTSCTPFSVFERCSTSCTVDPLAEICTESSFPFCNELRYVYGSTLTLTEYVCGSTPATSTAFPTEPATRNDTSSTADATTSASLAPPSASSAPSGRPSTGPPIATDFNTGAAVGGAIGGFVILAILTFWIWAYLRKKRLNKSTIRATTGTSTSKKRPSAKKNAKTGVGSSLKTSSAASVAGGK